MGSSASKLTRPPRASRALLLVALAVLACHRSPQPRTAPDAGASGGRSDGLVCVEQPDGCLFCAGKDEQGAFLEPDQSRPLVCNPDDEDTCAEFCSLATPSCALPWWKGPSCLVRSDIEFRRALFNLRAADRPEVVLSGRVVDDGGRRIEGASVRVWLVWGSWPGPVPLVEEVSGKDGGFRVPLRSGPWGYAVQVSHPEHASTVVDRIPADKLDRATGAPPRIFRMGAPQSIRGRLVDLATGQGVPDATLHAVRSPDDVIQIAEASSGPDGSFVLGGLENRRYHLNVSKFGWRPIGANAAVAPAQKITIKLIQANVIRGSVVDAQNEPEPSATVAAVLASAPGVPSPPIVWTTDSDGHFAQDRFIAGTYYLWARRGDMLAYPPTRIELTDTQIVEARMTLSHKGARVVGTVQFEDDRRPPGETSVELSSRSPLSFPRDPVAKVDGKGGFVLSGVLPGRYSFELRAGIRGLAIVRGPREIEIPIEPGSTLRLKEPLVVRPRLDD